MADFILTKPELFWFIMGLALFLFELIIPGFFIFFFALGAWITALVCLIGEPGINMQIIIFSVTSILSLIALRRILKKRFFNSKNNEAEKIEDEFTGKEAVALTGFSAGEKGKVEFKGTLWQAESESSVKEGEPVIIVEKKSIKLIVKPKN